MLEVGKRYIVTNPSDDGTFEVGDHIQLYNNGDIGCREAAGWIKQQDVAAASAGMEVELDKEWNEARIKKLLAEIDELRLTKR